MTWLAAVVLRPLVTLALFGLALSLAYLIRPLIPRGRVKDLLYSRTFRHTHAEWFNAIAMLCIFGLVLFGIYISR